LTKIDPDTGLQQDVGPSNVPSITVSAGRHFSFGSLQVSWARADARDRNTGQPIPEAPRLIWDAVGTADRLPLHISARGEFEYVGAKPLGDGFVGVRVREIRGALQRSFQDGRMDLEVNFLLAAGFTGQTLETLAMPADSAPFERIVGVQLKSYVSLTWTYNFRRNHRPVTPYNPAGSRDLYRADLEALRVRPFSPWGKECTGAPERVKTILLNHRVFTQGSTFGITVRPNCTSCPLMLPLRYFLPPRA